MGDWSVTSAGGLDQVPILVDGLRKQSDSGKQTYPLRILLPKDAPLSALWAKIKALGYDRPDWLEQAEKRWSDSNEQKCCVHPFDELEVVQGRPSENAKCINLDEPLIVFANRHLKKEINLNISEGDLNDYGLPLESLRDDGGLEISFHRTIRMPDDNKLHQLPASLGTFPLFNVSAFGDKLPDNIVQQGGVFLPMWQREALWISFTAPKKYALRVFVGRVNAVSGVKMDDRTDEAQGIELLQDYVVVPGQEWLDGICVAPGIVRQFAAMPLGSGYTVEGQKTGEEKFGGLQIEIIPSYEKSLRTWLPEPTGRGAVNDKFDWPRVLDEQKTPSELGLNPGNKIRSYPSSPVYYAPYAIADLVRNAPKEDTRIQALYRQIEDPRTTEWMFPLANEMCGSLSGQGSPFPVPFTAQQSECGPLPHAVKHTAPLEAENHSGAKALTKDLKAMGLAAGGKLVQDIYRDRKPARIWNEAATRLVNIHILDPASCEKVTHIIPPPPPIDAMGYIEANMPFFVVEEQVNNRVDGGDFNNVSSVSAIDKEKGVTVEPAFDPSKPKKCQQCETRLCDCILRPCDHQFCNVCVKRLDDGQEVSSHQVKRWKCPTCGCNVSHIAGFSAPMNLPGEEALKVKAPVHVLKIEDGRVRFRSIQTTRI